MSSNKTPLQQVKDQGGKEKLVDRIMGMIERGEEEADALRKRLLAVSNQKLLRLAQNADALKSRYGSRDKLAGSLADALGRAKDSGYVKKLGTYSPGRLVDMARRLVKDGAARPAKAPAKKAAAPKAAAAKAPRAQAAKPKAAKAESKTTSSRSKKKPGA